jgi:hypothetical protein
MKRVKARLDFMTLDVTTHKSFKNGGRLRARKLTSDAVMSIGLAQGFAAALLLCGADFRFSLRFWLKDKIAHEFALSTFTLRS